jgi:rhodanese-related sulfurtransferase
MAGMIRRTAISLAAALVAAVALAAEPVVAPVTQQALVERQQQGEADLVVVDVRSPEEFAAGHVPGAINIPHDRIGERLAEVPRDKDVVLYCQSGRRAGIAAQVLAEQGYTRLLHLEGDIAAWKANGRPLE